MALFIEHKTLKNKKLGEDLNLSVVLNEMAGRILVEFKSEDGKITLQKSFQNTVEGRTDSEKFQKKIKSLKDLRDYFGLNKKEKKSVTKRNS